VGPLAMALVSGTVPAMPSVSGVKTTICSRWPVAAPDLDYLVAAMPGNYPLDQLDPREICLYRRSAVADYRRG
jgi:hypothetical protein